MNAIDPFTPRPAEPAPQMVPGLAQAAAGFRLLRRLGILVAAGAALLLALGEAGSFVSHATIQPAMMQPAASLPMALSAAFAASPLPPLMLGALLLVLAGLAGAAVMARARHLATLPPEAGRAAPARRRYRPRLLPRPAPRGDLSLIGRAARWPQAVLVSLFALACLWLLHAIPLGAPPSPASADTILGAAAIALCFPLLIAERYFAGMPVQRLPEAPALHALFLFCVVVWTGAGLVQIAAGIGLPYTGAAAALVAALLAAAALELALRAMGRCFLPPPEPAAARAAITSLLAGTVAAFVQARSIAAPVRRHLGLDMSRSWALSYLRAATPHVALLLALLVWGLSGIVLVGLDQRAIYERFGAPVAVLHPGLHAILPWPMGRVRRVEYGTVHETTLSAGGRMPQAARVGAEAPAPADANRLWEQPHPAELTFLIASTDPIVGSGGPRQSFQVVSADLRLLYRIGLTDADALQATYRTTDPEALLRSEASRLFAGFFAGRTLDAVLGENRETMAEQLRTTLQQDLARIGCGIEVAAVVIEAIHPPAGAAEAYHHVQAAEIMAAASIAAERGRAIANLAKARQYATDLVAQARATAAETAGAASSDLTRFNADHDAATAGGQSFLIDRYLTDLTRGLAQAPLIIVDHRIPLPDAPVIDLRPPGARTAPAAGRDME